MPSQSAYECCWPEWDHGHHGVGDRHPWQDGWPELAARGECATTSARMLLVGPDEFGMGQNVPPHCLLQRRLVRLAEIRQHDVQGI